MKKLMVAIAAVASAFGLYAADTTYYSTGFDDAAEFNDGALIVGGLTGWTLPEGGTATQGAYDGDAYTGTRNAAFAEQLENPNYLAIKTTFGNPLARALDATVGDAAVYFDQVVKFTAMDEAPTETYENAKILVYALDVNADEDNAEPEVHLYAKAGKYVGTALSPETYDLGVLTNPDAFHRLTIKALKAYNNSALGFVIYVDTNAKAIQDTGKVGYDAAAAAKLTIAAKALNGAKKLLPALVDGLNLTSAEFDGQGSIDDFIATTAEPEFAKDKFFALSWDENVTSFKYTFAGGTVDANMTATDKTEYIPFVENDEITVSDLTYTQNWDFDKIEGTDCSVNGKVIKLGSAENAKAKIFTKDVTPRVTVTIGQDVTTYPSIAKAFAALGAENATVKLNEALDIDAADEMSEGLMPNSVTGDVTIDLNGLTITGKGTQSELYVIQKNKGKLIITDSSEGKQGAIVATGWKGAVRAKENLEVSEGKFVGAVVADADSSVSGGKFLKGEETEFPLTLATGFKAELAGTTPDYWVISEKSKFTVTISAATGAKVTVLAGATPIDSGDEVYADTVLTISAVADKYYDGLTLTVNGENFTSGDDHKVAGAVAIVATAEAKEYKATYYEADGETEVSGIGAEYKTFTIVNAESKTLPQPEKAGYTFVDWYASVDDLTDPTAEPLGNDCFAAYAAEELDLDAYAKWTANTYAISYDLAGGTAGQDAPTSYTFSEAVQAITLVAPTKDGVTFDGWTVDATATAAGITVDGNQLSIPASCVTPVTLTATWKSAGPEPVDPSEGTVVPDPSDGSFIVTPAEGKMSVELQGANKDMTIKVTTSADFVISGLNGATVKVMCNGVDIAGVCLGGQDGNFSTALDPDQTTPAFTEGESGEEPLVIGDNVGVTVTSVAGLAYTLVRGEEVGTIATDIQTVKGTGDAIKLEDANKPAGKAFYKVSVSKAEVK